MMDDRAFLFAEFSKKDTNKGSDGDLELQVNKKLKEISKTRITSNNPCLLGYNDFIDVIGEETRSADANHSYLQSVDRSPSPGSECSSASRSSSETSSIYSIDSQSGSRTNYTPEQVQKLNEAFEKNKYPDAEEREKIASTVRVSEKKVKIWFQNKRARSKPRNSTHLRVHPSIIPPLYLPQTPMYQSLPSPRVAMSTSSLPQTARSFVPFSGLPQMSPATLPRLPVEAYGNFMAQQPHISPYQLPLSYQRPDMTSRYIYPYMYPPY